MNPDRWLVISVPAGDPESSELVASALVDATESAVVEAGGRLEAYVAPPQDVEAFVDAICDRLATLAGGLAHGFSWRWEEDRDWSREWRSGLTARRVGERFVVTPSWVDPAVEPGDHVIVIDPEMAFGTGEHATTRAALRLLERVVAPGHVVLDVGTGSAILAIGAAMLGAARVLAVECDADAIGNARDNVGRNGVVDRVEVRHGLVDEAFLANHPGEFDVILANVLSGVLIPLLQGFRQSLRPGGRVILGGILTIEAPTMRRAIDDAGLHILQEDVEEEWWSVLCARADAP
ncbi:MAG TPA: 50S ribosomal protein L11 methyltransferase [Longimicrobiales bacterium]|nr:50S ribosomal protein L11 methyltransferase [Longimicrobiales bacterium]